MKKVVALVVVVVVVVVGFFACGPCGPSAEEIAKDSTVAVVVVADTVKVVADTTKGK